ncbi:unnamed protein product [Protopolystoma xenopodis]|uniref:DDE-1 domain-containing protein n=1 Tax=Protopolystoma xenopodis TaxID=117903 RepID=A0A448XJS9_9PLAT|nr:unnamed protein product [Protopolystoma xenopodis]
MDEVPVTFDCPSNRTVNLKGAKMVSRKTTGNEKNRYSVVLACAADGTKLKPMLTFKRKTCPKEEISNGILVHMHEKGWMDTDAHPLALSAPLCFSRPFTPTSTLCTLLGPICLCSTPFFLRPTNRSEVGSSGSYVVKQDRDAIISIASNLRSTASEGGLLIRIRLQSDQLFYIHGDMDTQSVDEVPRATGNPLGLLNADRLLAFLRLRSDFLPPPAIMQAS